MMRFEWLKYRLWHSVTSDQPNDDMDMLMIDLTNDSSESPPGSPLLNMSPVIIPPANGSLQPRSFSPVHSSWPRKEQDKASFKPLTSYRTSDANIRTPLPTRKVHLPATVDIYSANRKTGTKDHHRRRTEPEREKYPDGRENDLMVDIVDVSWISVSLGN